MENTAGGGAGHSGVETLQLGRHEPVGEPGAAIVVGFDRSAASLAALAKAAEIGRRLGAELHVIHVVDLSDYPIDPDADDWEDQAVENLQEEGERVSDSLARYPYGWSYVTVRSEPAEALDRAADEVGALMIVVGVRSHGWQHLLKRLSSPSVSHQLINHCHVPVLVVSYHPPDH